MRLLHFLITIACLAAGAVVGALNRAPVVVDLGFSRLPTNLGVSLLVALLLGVLVGGLAISASVVLPLRRRLVRAERQGATPAPTSGS